MPLSCQVYWLDTYLAASLLTHVWCVNTSSTGRCTSIEGAPNYSSLREQPKQQKQTKRKQDNDYLREKGDTSIKRLRQLGTHEQTLWDLVKEQRATVWMICPEHGMNTTELSVPIHANTKSGKVSNWGRAQIRPSTHVYVHWNPPGVFVGPMTNKRRCSGSWCTHTCNICSLFIYQTEVSAEVPKVQKSTFILLGNQSAQNHPKWWHTEGLRLNGLESPRCMMFMQNQCWWNMLEPMHMASPRI